MVELLVVMAIIGILTAAAVPSIAGLMRAYQVSIAGQLIVSQLTLARQTALSTNHAVQVRFYYLPDYNTDPTSALVVYRGMQSFSEGDISPTAASGSAVPLTPLTKPSYFPQPVIASVNATSSTLFSTPAVALTPAVPTDPMIGSYSSNSKNNYSYTYVRFAPGGGTNLTSANNTATFYGENAKIVDVANGLPANYLTISIDPVTGSLQTYRP